jgi:GT2 family glycosyltransferase
VDAARDGLPTGRCLPILQRDLGAGLALFSIVQMVQSKLVSVIVVCTNEKHHLPVCLESLHRQTYPNVEVIVVDNGSTDGSREYIESAHPWVRVHSTGANVGYASANNAGLSAAAGDYLAVLNPDTEVDPDFVTGLVEAIERDGAGLATSRICFFGDRGVINACGNEVHITGIGYCRGLGELVTSFDSCVQVASISGCAFMMRRDVLARIGGFDGDYFIYVEDTDLSIRANIAGYRIMFAPRSIVYHKYSLKMTPRKFFLLERNRRQTLIKNLRWGTLVALLPPILLTGALMWVFAITHGPEYLRAEFQAHLWIYRNWNLILVKRRRIQALRTVGDREVVRLLSSALPADQVIGPGLFGRLASLPLNLAYRLLAVPVRIVG